jgi:hypothetical protein
MRYGIQKGQHGPPRWGLNPRGGHEQGIGSDHLRGRHEPSSHACEEGTEELVGTGRRAKNQEPRTKNEEKTQERRNKAGAGAMQLVGCDRMHRWRR